MKKALLLIFFLILTLHITAQDADNDGILDANETTLGTNPNNVDSDGDGIQDGTEIGLTSPQGSGTDTTIFIPDTDPSTTTDPLDDDSDDDGILDGNEDTDYDGRKDNNETSPNLIDTDNDGIQDGTEKGLTSSQGSDTNMTIFIPDTDPTTTTYPLIPDTDGDGVMDGTEDTNANGAVDGTETNPNNLCSFILAVQNIIPSTYWNMTDCDGDGLGNAQEVAYGSDPLNPDTDGDSLGDGFEVDMGLNPTLVDTDGDGILDPDEQDYDADGILNGNEPYTAQNNVDSDGDGIIDPVEMGLTAPQTSISDAINFVADTDPSTTTDPYDKDTDGDGVEDGVEDANKNGQIDAPETDPNNMCDFDHTAQSLPTSGIWNLLDCDGDGLTNGFEMSLGLNPSNVDTDGDGTTDDLEVNSISGTLHYDYNNDGCDAGDMALEDFLIKTAGTRTYLSSIQPDATYANYMLDGTFTTAPQNTFPSYFALSPTEHTATYTGGNIHDTVDFCLTANTVVNDVNVSIMPYRRMRQGQSTSYRIDFSNVGTATVSIGSITFTYDDTRLTFSSATAATSSTTSNSLTFDYTNLAVFESRSIIIHFNVGIPPNVEIGDVITCSAQINPISGDNTVSDNTSTSNATVIGAIDPNDITVLEGDEVLYSDIDEYLHYTIRFQNVGTADAINIVVKNNISSKLDMDSFKLLGSSFPCTISRSGIQYQYVFNNIHLLDSTTNEAASHGYISYKIKPKATVNVGDNIINNAQIYFDYNDAVNTNTVYSTIVNTLSIPREEINGIKIYPNPVKNILSIELETNIFQVSIYNSLGQQVLIFKNQQPFIDVSKLRKGVYLLKVVDEQRSVRINRFIKN